MVQLRQSIYGIKSTTVWEPPGWAAHCFPRVWFWAGCSRPAEAPSDIADTASHYRRHLAERHSPATTIPHFKTLLKHNCHHICRGFKKTSKPNCAFVVLTCSVCKTTLYQLRLLRRRPFFSVARQCWTASSNLPFWQNSWTNLTLTWVSAGRATSSVCRRSNSWFQPCCPWRLNRRSCTKAWTA